MQKKLLIFIFFSFLTCSASLTFGYFLPANSDKTGTIFRVDHVNENESIKKIKKPVFKETTSENTTNAFVECTDKTLNVHPTTSSTKEDVAVFTSLNQLIPGTPAGVHQFDIGGETFETNVNEAGFFITTWETTSSNESITIPTAGNGYNYTVNWGDGTEDSNQTGDASHTYASPGVYTVMISGDFPRIFFNANTTLFGTVGDAVNAKKLLTIEQWGGISWSSMTYAFAGCSRLDIHATDAPDLSAVTNMSFMFADATSLTSLGSGPTWDVGNVENMVSLFEKAANFNQSLNDWDIHNVLNQAFMFSNASTFDQYLGSWTLNATTAISYIFSGSNMSCANTTGTLVGWEHNNPTVSNLTYLDDVSYGTKAAEAVTALEARGWSILISTSASACALFEITNIADVAVDENSAYDITPVVAGTYIGALQYTLSGDDADEFTLDPATGSVSMSAKNFEVPEDADGDNIYEVSLTATDEDNNTTLVDWTVTIQDVSEPEFFITTWETTSPNESITIPTAGSGYNYTISWGDGTEDTNQTGDASHTYVTPGIYTVMISGDFPRIFFNANAIIGGGSIGDGVNADKLLTIEQWGYISWSSMAYAFAGCSRLDIRATDAPDLSIVTEMSYLFTEAISLTSLGNGPTWDVSNVENMGALFSNALTFDHDLNEWDVRNVTDMSSMFVNAGAFDHYLGSWVLNSNVDMTEMFFSPVAPLSWSCENFTGTLIGWEHNNPTVTDVVFHANATYGTQASHAVTALQARGWTVAALTSSDACPRIEIMDIPDENVNENSAYNVTPVVSGTLIGALTYTLSGDDADDFTVDATTGIVSMDAQNHENPLDADLNNAYEVTLRATDEDGNYAEVSWTVEVTDVTETIAFVLSSSTGDENVSSTDLEVTLNSPIAGDASVDYTVTGSATGSGTDYTLADGTFTISEGNTTGNISITSIVDDALDEPNETVIVTLSSPVNASLGTNDLHTYTIIDNDATTATIAFDATTSNGDESVPTANLAVSLSEVSGKDVSVDYAVTGTATGSGTDYTLTDGTLTISAGNLTGNISIASIVNDLLDEPDETVIVTLSSPVNASLGIHTVHTYTIEDDDATTTTIAFNATASNGDESMSAATLAVSLSEASGQDVFVNYSVTGTATGGGTDYLLTNGTLTITPGNITKNISITSIVDDLLDEPDETVVVTLSSPVNASLGTNDVHTYTIIDNDATTTTIAFDATTSNGDESVPTANLAVSLSEVSGKDVSVDYAVTGTATGSG
ncbi:MAG: BspA family leucine-rich repeat surface protein, partial [Bacteroidota bacterium]